MNSNFKDATTSPLKAKDLKRFNGLDFFPLDSSYYVSASINKISDSQWFDMKTTTDRMSKERIYGVVTFSLNDTVYHLNVYQGKDNMATEDMQDYLFLPFLDITNGESTYAGGRYIDLRISSGDTIQIDFNKAYNPYCVYNEKYSCPIVPQVNYISTAVTAGMKMFDKQ